MNTATTSGTAFLAGANTIGLRLCRDAIWSGSRCTWLGSSMEFLGGAWNSACKPAGADLYGGTSGIALFLAELYAATGERSLLKAALGGAELALSMVDRMPPAGTIGFYTGRLGVAFALLRVGHLLGDPSLIERALDVLDSVLVHDLEANAPLDVISGCAGAIPVLLRLYKQLDRPACLDLAIRCGNHLQATALPSGNALSWNTLETGPETPSRNLTGFSHGTAGVGWALTELWSATQDAALLDTAERAFAYERSLFSPRHQNWPDLRGTDGRAGDEPGYALAWCHGAPGIGLSRLRAYAITGGETCRQEAEVAIATTLQGLQATFGTPSANFSLCHGMLGNADLLLEADRAHRRPNCRAMAEQLGAQALAYAETRQPWPCGVLNGGETPGLLLGVAGIGYFLLRLADPRLESVLIVGPPPKDVLLETYRGSMPSVGIIRS